MRNRVVAAFMYAVLQGGPTHAATRVCGDFIAGSGEDRQSEMVAKQQALTAWTSAAAKLGPAFTLWRNAAQKSLACTSGAAGWKCAANARPCGVAQVPGTMPPGTHIPKSPAPRPSKWIDARAAHTVRTYFATSVGNCLADFTEVALDVRCASQPGRLLAGSLSMPSVALRRIASHSAFRAEARYSRWLDHDI